MPILRLHLSGSAEGQERGYTVSAATLLDPSRILPDYLLAGAKFKVFEKETITDVTPTFWEEEAENQYILQMKRTPEAAILRTLASGDTQPQLAGMSMNIEALAIRSIRQVHIPAHTEIVPISRRVEDNMVEVGAIVLRATAQEFALMQTIIANNPSQG